MELEWKKENMYVECGRVCVKCGRVYVKCRSVYVECGRVYVECYLWLLKVRHYRLFFS